MFNSTQRIDARLPEDHPPILLVIVDTEEEFDWGRPFDRNNTATTSIQAQPVIHDKIFDRYGIVPTYCIDYPVATTPDSIATLKGLMDNGQCEIGTHLHPWVTPPYEEVVNTFNSYAGNLPAALEHAKLTAITEAITQNFGRAPTTFKAGRYGLGPHTAASMAQLGYTVDASIVPHTSFTADGGPDFSAYTDQPYWFRSEERTLLELPVTTAYCGHLKKAGSALYPSLQSAWAKKLRLGGIASKSGLLERIRLTPEGCNSADLIRLARSLRSEGCQVFSLTYHSPSLVPGHTPYVKSEAELQHFLRTIEAFCDFFASELHGQFMSIARTRELLAQQLSTHPLPKGEGVNLAR